MRKPLNKSLVIPVSLGIAALIGLALITVQNNSAEAARREAQILKGLTAEELTAILKNEALASRQSIEEMKSDPQKRKQFLKGLGEFFAVAAVARREGFAENQQFAVNVAYKKNKLIAEMYRIKLSKGLGRLYVVPKEQIEAVWNDSSNLSQFNEFMKVMREIRIADSKSKGKSGGINELRGELLEKAKGNWARTKILSDRAISDQTFMDDPALKLRLRIIEAGILTADYLRQHYKSEILPTDADIEKYLAGKPEYRPDRKPAIAKKVLERALAGEDFDKLAREYSEDRASKNRGGIYKEVKTNVLWPEVEAAALKLREGEIAKQLIRSNYGFHIVKLDSRTGDVNDDKLKFTVRHIVLQHKFEEPGAQKHGIPAPFMTAQEIAFAAVSRIKKQIFIDRIVKENPVDLPGDFPVELPVIEKNQASKGQ